MNYRKRQAMMKNSPVLNTLLACGLAAVVIFSITYKLNYYYSPDFWQNLVAGIHNTLFDVVFIGVLIFWLNKRVETRIEIQRYLEEIDVWRNDGSPMAIKKNLTSIRRLNEHGVYNIDLSKTILQGIDLTEIKLPESNLSEAECFMTIFQNANLNRTTLDRANLRQAVVIRADLSGASLRGTVLEYADLQEANLKGADFTNANISNAIWRMAIYDKK